MDRIRRNRLLRFLVHGLSILATGALVLAYLSPYVHPVTVSFIPLFGLAYPIIFVVFLLMMILELFFNKWWSLSMFVVLLLGGGLHFRTFAFGNGDDPGKKASLKIMSYNVHLFDVYNGQPEIADKTRKNILKYLEQERPDIVCFQEFYHQDQPTDFITKDTIIPLLGIKDYQERYAHKRAGRKNFGIAIFTRYPIVEKGEVNFNPDRPSFNYAIYSDIVFKEDTLRIYNVHFQSIRLNADEKAVFEKENSESGIGSVVEKISDAYPVRAEQAEILLKHIRKSPHPVVVCGDFNDTPMSYTYNCFNAELTDAFRNCSFGIGKTYAGSIPAGRIDYIFHSESLGSHDFKIQSNALSDHFAIQCEVFVK